MTPAVLAVCLAALGAPAVGQAPAPSRPDRPNIVLLLTDDQRWDTIAALGRNPDVKTPTLDGLVARGFHFANAYNMGSMIPAVCLPSRTMIMTGRSLWHLPPISGDRAPEGLVLLPRLFRRAGYETFHCGKSENACRYGNAEFATNVTMNERTPETSRRFADRVIAFLDGHDPARPFFAYLAPPVPHDPRVAPERFRAMYDPERLSLPPSFLPRHPFDNGELDVRDEKLAPVPREPDRMRRELADYYAAITNLDHELGRILEALDRRGLADRTILIVSSDQGLAVGGCHGLMGKQNLYEHVKPPLVVAGPGIPKGRSDALVYLFDLMPTLCELAGIPVPDAAEGRSLVPVIDGRSDRFRDHLLGAYRECQRMVRDERWKLIEYRAADGRRHTQLFDLANDPDELRNLAGEEPQGERLARMRRLLAEARRSFDDPTDFDAEGGPAAP